MIAKRNGIFLYWFVLSLTASANWLNCDVLIEYVLTEEWMNLTLWLQALSQSEFSILQMAISPEVFDISVWFISWRDASLNSFSFLPRHARICLILVKVALTSVNGFLYAEVIYLIVLFHLVQIYVSNYWILWEKGA